MPKSFSVATTADLQVPGIARDSDEGADRPALLVAVLDGADEFSLIHGEDRATAKAAIHRSISRFCVEEGEGHWFAPLANRFSEAAFAQFYGTDSVRLSVGAALSIHQRLNDWNLEHQLNWIEQVHSRVVIFADKWDGVLELMPQAMRGQVVVHFELSELFRALSPSFSNANVRCAQPSTAWREVSKQIEEGIVLPGQELHVGRHFAKIQMKFDANRAARIAAAASAAVG